MKWHPDKNKDDPQAHDRFQDLSAAYEVCVATATTVFAYKCSRFTTARSSPRWCKLAIIYRLFSKFILNSWPLS